jgi:hypothetical protein
MNVEEARRHVRGILPNVTSMPGDFAVPRGWMEPDQDMFPVPELVLFVFRDLLGLRRYGPMEKMRWGVAFLFNGLGFAFEYRKFGLTLVHEDRPGGEAQGAVADLLDRTRRAVRVAERVLESTAQTAAAAGEVAVANQYRSLRDAYRFFRRKARDAYRAPDPEPTRDAKGRVVSFPFMQQEREGGYFSSAMMDAYFSTLEHLAVIAFAFSGDDASEGGLLDFLSCSLSDKLKKLLSPHVDSRAKRELELLRDVRETWRNPLAHGGIERGVGSLFFHVPGLGTMPARLSGVRNSIHFHLTPVAQETFESVCRRFDRFDLFLSARKEWVFALAWGRTGLPVRFDQQGRAEYQAASGDRAALEELITETAHWADYHANMEY